MKVLGNCGYLYLRKVILWLPCLRKFKVRNLVTCTETNKVPILKQFSRREKRENYPENIQCKLSLISFQIPTSNKSLGYTVNWPLFQVNEDE